MAETEPDLGALRDRLRQSSLAGKAARLRPDEVKALYFLLDRALDLRANPQSLDREADGAAYIITGRFPSLDKRLRAHADDTVAVPGLYAEEREALADVLAEYARLRANENDRRQAGQAAMEAAARIDTAASHGVPCGSEDPVTANDWDRVLRYARCGGTERAV